MTETVWGCAVRRLTVRPHHTDSYSSRKCQHRERRLIFINTNHPTPTNTSTSKTRGQLRPVAVSPGLQVSGPRPIRGKAEVEFTCNSTTEPTLSQVYEVVQPSRHHCPRPPTPQLSRASPCCCSALVSELDALGLSGHRPVPTSELKARAAPVVLTRLCFH